MKRSSMLTAASVAVAVLTLTVITVEITAGQDVSENQDRQLARELLSYVQEAHGGSYLGTRIEDVDADDAKRLRLSEIHGVLITEVLEETPAAKAGLRQDDVLVTWNGARLEGVVQLQRLMRETPAGRSVRLGVFRDGKARDISVTLGEHPEAERVSVYRMDPQDRERMRERMEELRSHMGELRERLYSDQEAVRAYGLAVSGRGRLGVSIQSLGDQLAEYFGVEHGALITSVLEDSPAQRAGLKAGDVIVAIAGEDVEGPRDVTRTLRDRDAGPVDVRIMRDRRARTISVELEERQSRAFCLGDDCMEWAIEDFAVTLPPLDLPAIEIPAFEVAPFEVLAPDFPVIFAPSGRIVIDV